MIGSAVKFGRLSTKHKARDKLGEEKNSILECPIINQGVRGKKLYIPRNTQERFLWNTKHKIKRDKPRMAKSQRNHFYSLKIQSLHSKGENG